MTRITRRTVEAFRLDGNEAWLWDSGDHSLPGFGLRIRRGGRKTYYVQYRTGGRGSPSRRVRLGLDSELTPEKARSAAEKVLAKVRLGGDPAGDRNNKRAEATIARLCERYLAEHVEAHNKPSTAAEVRRIVDTRIKPALGRLHVSDLTRARVKEWHSDMRETPYEANRCLAYLSKLMNLAAREWELRPDNPVLGVKRFPERKRERFFSDEELQRIGAALRAAEEKNAVHPNIIATLRLLALTGLRLGEALALTWDQVDLDASCLRLRDAKAGSRTVPLGNAARVLLSGLERVSPVVLWGPNPNQPVSKWAVQNFWKRVRAQAKVPDTRLHDFRHTTGTYAAQTGANAFAVRDILGHKTMAMTGRYVGRAVDPLRATADAVAGRVDAAMAGRTAKVVPLAKRRR
jgi:integrase